jgi:hypothetical protein
MSKRQMKNSLEMFVYFAYFSLISLAELGNTEISPAEVYPKEFYIIRLM